MKMKFYDLDVGDFFEAPFLRRHGTNNPLFMKTVENDGFNAVRMDDAEYDGGSLYIFDKDEEISFVKIKLYKEYE